MTWILSPFTGCDGRPRNNGACVQFSPSASAHAVPSGDTNTKVQVSPVSLRHFCRSRHYGDNPGRAPVHAVAVARSGGRNSRGDGRRMLTVVPSPGSLIISMVPS